MGNWILQVSLSHWSSPPLTPSLTQPEVSLKVLWKRERAQRVLKSQILLPVLFSICVNLTRRVQLHIVQSLLSHSREMTWPSPRVKWIKSWFPLTSGDYSFGERVPHTYCTWPFGASAILLVWKRCLLLNALPRWLLFLHTSKLDDRWKIFTAYKHYKESTRVKRTPTLFGQDDWKSSGTFHFLYRSNPVSLMV